MPAGKTHDRITIWVTPWVTLAAMIATSHWGYTALVVGGFLFASTMFGPDLDIRSVQSQRWGWLRWIWRPYRRSLRHRSWLSHGFLAGTVVRCLYLFVWVVLGILLVLEISNTVGHTTVTWNDLGQTIGQVFTDYWRVWVAIAIGIELGAMSHYTADWLVSGWKREQRKTAKKPYSSRQQPRK
ncbi:MAG: metal-binding protein [Leptolyngbya sp. SIOISBB]|nr:metal-binding protein [Leptolyngbya sp. SIOISBB]